MILFFSLVINIFTLANCYKPSFHPRNVNFSLQAFKEIREIFDIDETAFENLNSCKIGETFGNSPTLVLNADYKPLSFMPLSLWHWQDSLRAVMSGKATVLNNYDLVIRGVASSINIPSVIALKKYHAYASKVPSLSRRNIFIRDSFTCQVIIQVQCYYLVFMCIYAVVLFNTISVK